MQFNILTIFPEVLAPYCGASIIGRAQKKKLLKINIVNIRDFAADKHHKTDDEPFGGGPGMVMLAQPIYDCLAALKLPRKRRVILTSPQGRPWTQKLAREMAAEKNITVICGHYEGVDERIMPLVTDEISIGDYVLTGGELPALVLLDSVARMLPGVVGKEESIINETFYDGVSFDHPHYTRPANFRGLKVPEVLLNGNHKAINEWRKKMAEAKRNQVRPEL
ncbi:MAG: tRNA (guanosine(37)-N1)-methyltransferase TrmD [Candidatus Margulisbacteria bacterium]|jgi:tRNA (guanine37-N1)-methyltransferase|nr:tRNA (guanosine(37)-N1)-methyltransferase TrmD [Candidatus Margulisiibacteriota bacterium]